MINSRTTQYVITQANHSKGDAIPINERVIKYTVKCHPLSGTNLWIGVNEDANEGNLLQPGESMTVGGTPGYFTLDVVYLEFDPANSDGKALVIVERDTGKDSTCN